MLLELPYEDHAKLQTAFLQYMQERDGTLSAARGRELLERFGATNLRLVPYSSMSAFQHAIKKELDTRTQQRPTPRPGHLTKPLLDGTLTLNKQGD